MLDEDKTGSVIVADKKSHRVSLKNVVSIVLIVGLVAFIAGTRSGEFMTWVSGKTSPSQLDFSSLNKIYGAMRDKYDGQLDVDKLIDGAKHGMVDAAGDPYTLYLNPEEAAEFDSDLNGTFEGIGAELGKIDGRLTVLGVIGDSPAQSAGLQPRDVILKVNDEEMAGLTVGAAVKKIRGPKGTSVKLSIFRNDNLKDFNITRDTIVTESVKSEVLEGGIGYLKISRFDDKTSGLARKVADSFKQQGIQKVIFDLRGNGGGLLTAAQDVAGIWLEDKAVVSQRRGDTTTATLRSGADAPLAGVKTIVLIDGASASASEIVVGAFKDYGVATLVGEKTYGKGSVQEVENLGDGSQLKVTIAKWYTPKGKNIDKAGIKPDVEVKLSEDDFKNGRDPQKDTALELLR